MNRPRKILYIHHGSGKAGGANSLLRMIQHLDTTRFHSIVACGYSEPGAREFFEKSGFQPIDMPMARFVHFAKWWPLYSPRGIFGMVKWLLVKQPRSLFRLRNILKQTQPDIVHLNSLTVAPLIPMIKRHNIPVLLHVREPVASGTLGVRRLWLRHLARQADHVIYICEDNRDRLTGPMPNASVLYDPIPFDKFDKSLNGHPIRLELGIAEKSKVLFFPGGSSLVLKGIFPFLEALAYVREHNDNIIAIIPGIDTLAHSRRTRNPHSINATIAKLKIENNIVRAPFTSAVEKYYAASDIVVVPFVKPHFSLGVLEAGAMAKPVVGSDIGGINEVLTEGRNGLLACPGDAKDLSEKIVALLSNPDKASALGKAGYKISYDNYRSAQYPITVMNIYDRIETQKQQTT